MNAFLDLLKYIFCGLLVGVAAATIGCWLIASLEAYTYTKQNNVLLRELCVENGLNVDNLISTTQNDTLNLKIVLKGE